MRVLRDSSKTTKTTAYSQHSDVEKACLRRLQEQGKTPSMIAEMMGRDLSSVARHCKRNLCKKGKFVKGVGRPRGLTEAQIDRIAKTMKQMVLAANSEYQITAGMVRRALKLKCSDKLVLNALHSRGLRFHPMREKPVRTEQDEKERLAFARLYGGKPIKFWVDGVQAYLDNKFFPAYLSPEGRAYARKRAARGSFRIKGDGLAKGHVKPRKKLEGNIWEKCLGRCGHQCKESALLSCRRR